MKRTLILAAVAVAALAFSEVPAQAHPTDMDVVASFYPKYLHRRPDKGGMNYWREEHHRGLPVREIEARILSGDEYYHLHGSTSDGFIVAMLTDVNGAATQDRVAFYLGRLQATGSRLAVAREVLGLAAPSVIVVPQQSPVAVQPPTVSQLPQVIDTPAAPPVTAAPAPSPPGVVYVPAAPPAGPTTVVVPEPVYVPTYAPGPVYYPQYAPFRSSVSLNFWVPFGRR
jgi:hypothetical protein